MLNNLVTFHISKLTPVHITRTIQQSKCLARNCSNLTLTCSARHRGLNRVTVYSAVGNVKCKLRFSAVIKNCKREISAHISTSVTAQCCIGHGCPLTPGVLYWDDVSELFTTGEFSGQINPFWCRIHLWFRLMGGLQAKSMTSQRNRAVKDGGYVLLWQRYDNKKMVDMCYHGNVWTTTKWWLCVTMETMTLFYIFNSTVIDWTCFFILLLP